jgi:transcriptional regulator with XRE-family HTH domain
MDKVPPQIAVSVVIRALREELKISQDDFAALIGMHRTYYSSIERGERNLTLETLVRVAAGLKTDVATLAQRAKI